jgi:glycosyltransferase involved in cell wall biosynthesis
MKDALRIALIASNRFPIRQPFAGGLEAHVWHLARALTDRGHHVSVFAAPGSDPDIGCTPLTVRDPALSQAARTDSSMPPATFMTDHHAYLTLMLTLARSTDFDLIHNHSLHHLPIAMAPMLSIPMLTTVHTPPTPWLESALIVTGAAGTELAAVSEHTAAAWRTTANRITVVPNGIDIDQWPLGPGGPYLAWFGRITPEKAPHMAIAVAQRAHMPLVLAGPISDSAYFADQVAPHLDKDIRYAGHLEQNELARLVGGAAAALVTPMWDEPYGLVVAEAMSCGTPVVAFARGGVPELVGDTGGRLVTAGDIEGMAQAIPTAIKLSRTQVHCHAVRRCSLDSMLATYLARYRQMIDEVSEGNDDRVLHPPPGLRPSGTGRQHRRSDEHPSYGAHLAGHS